MTEDQQTFKRAMSAALVGLGAQVLLTAAMALVGIYAQAPAVNAAAWYMLGGVPVWIVLAVLFHQQRQERIEALEAEQLAEADAASAAIFNEAGDQLRLARKRLGNLIKYWLNIVSLGVAAYLLAVGGYHLFKALSSDAYLEALRNIATTLDPGADAAAIKPQASVGIIAVVALAIGFIAFLVARYVAGMTRVKSWQPLRGGAGYMMGSGFVALLVMLAAILRYFDVALPGFVLLAFVVPSIMILLGIEMVLGFVFGLYRPRRPGEAPKPAFESRLLGWLTRPESLGKIVGETLNYQFGFEISSSWFYRLLARAIVPLIALGAAVLIALSSLVVVGPHQNAVITRFGQFRRIEQPGASWKLPWPIERAAKYDVYQVQSMDIASSSKEQLEPGVAILWTNEHGGPETHFFLTPQPVAPGEDEDADSAVAAGLIGVRVTIQYRIADLEQHVGESSAARPMELFRRQAEGVVSRFFAMHDAESLLSQVRTTAGDEIRRSLEKPARALGLEVMTVSLTSLHPPQNEDVAKTFLSRIEADITRQATIEEAQKDAVTTLTAVAGSRDKALRIAEAIAEADRLQTQLTRAAASGETAPGGAERLAEQQVAIEKLMDEAGGRAVSLIYQARAERWSHALGERARAMRLRSRHLAYQQAPDYFRAREYFRVLTEALNNPNRPVRKYVMTVPGAGQATIRLNLEDHSATLGSTFDTGE